MSNTHHFNILTIESLASNPKFCLSKKIKAPVRDVNEFNRC